MKKVHARSRTAHKSKRWLPIGVSIISIALVAIGVSVAAFTGHTEKAITIAAPQTRVSKAPASPTTTPVVQKKQAPPATPAPAAPAAPHPAVTPAAAAQAVAAVAPAPSGAVSSLAPTPDPTPPTATDPTPPASTSTTSSSGSPAVTPSPSYSSTNWSGYLTTVGSFTAVSGSWVVPAPTSTSTSDNSLDAAWIGIGGVSTSDLIQTGTVDVVAPDGTITASAFYELLPANAQFISNLSVAPGDSMSASIVETATDSWTITITNKTSGKSVAASVSYTSSLSSAEWIEEDPSYGDGSLAPLDGFGTVQFSSCMATASNGSQLADALSPSSVTLVSSRGRPLATPSSLLNGAFSVAHS